MRQGKDMILKMFGRQTEKFCTKIQAFLGEACYLARALTHAQKRLEV